MPYYCKECGNYEDFYQEVTGTEYFRATHNIDNEGDFIETEDYETTDSSVDEYGQVYCKECDAEVEYYELEEIYELDPKVAKRLGYKNNSLKNLLKE